MCEPTHSIVQYDDPNDKNDNDSDDGELSPQAKQYPQSQLTGRLSRWAKKVRNWFHVSKLGRGHSETIGERTGVSLYSFDHVFSRYEAHWWNRTVVRDGGLHRDEVALTSAEDYAKLTSIGDLTQLRRFLEVSMQNTDRPESYIEAVWSSLLTSDGNRQFESDYNKYFKSKYTRYDLSVRLQDSKKRLEIVKFVIGFTRKRSLLVPEWSDDAALWSPEKKLIL